MEHILDLAHTRYESQAIKSKLESYPWSIVASNSYSEHFSYNVAKSFSIQANLCPELPYFPCHIDFVLGYGERDGLDFEEFMLHYPVYEESLQHAIRTTPRAGGWYIPDTGTSEKFRHSAWLHGNSHIVLCETVCADDTPVLVLSLIPKAWYLMLPLPWD